MDDEIVDLSLFRVHQHRAAVAADVIHGVGAGDKDRRRADNALRPRRRNKFQRDALTLLVAHDALPYRREYKHSQSPKPDMESVGDGTFFGLMRWEI